MKAFVENRSNHGFTLVELLVVMAISAALVLWVGFAFVGMSRLERSYRREAYVRTALVLALQRLEQKMSLACGINRETKIIRNGNKIHQEYSTFYFPCEAGGVSWETNEITQVFQLHNKGENKFLYATASNIVDFVTADRSYKSDFLSPLSSEIPSVRFNRLIIKPIKLPGENAPLNLLNVELAADFDVKDILGDYCVKTVSVQRVVRMWNVK